MDVDAIYDGEQVLIGGLMEHIEQAGVHSGDSACSLPPYELAPKIQDKLREQVAKMAEALGVRGWWIPSLRFRVKIFMCLKLTKSIAHCAFCL